MEGTAAVSGAWGGSCGVPAMVWSAPRSERPPREAAIKPQADAPPRCCLATTGPSTKKAAMAKFHRACDTRLVRYQLRLDTARQPATSSDQKPVRGLAAVDGTWSIARAMARTTQVAASVPTPPPA